MPIYEYECRQGHRFEELQKVTDAPLTKCINCGMDVRKLISKTSFQLKGSGWYQDGYSSSNTLDQPTTTTNESAPGTSKSNSQETKPSAKQAKEGENA